MYPLGICSLITFFLIAYAWRETRTQSFINRELNQEIEAFIRQGELANCQSRLKRSNNVLGRALRCRITAARKRLTKSRELSTRSPGCRRKLYWTMDPLFECCGQRCSNDWTLRHCQRDDQCLSSNWTRRDGAAGTTGSDIGEALNDRNRTDNRNPGDDSVFHPSQPFKFVNAPHEPNWY